MVTIREALTEPNPVLDTHELRPGPNTTQVQGAVAPETWVRWTDFNYKKLSNLFASELRCRYQGPPLDAAGALELDYRICNEDTLQAAFIRFLMPTVNWCLSDQPGSCYYGPGSRVPHELRPDWSCIAHGLYVNYVPGDTKLSSKFLPDMMDLEEWSKVLAQETYYIKTFQSRYGFIITDEHLVVLRISRQRTGEGLAAGRPYRSQTFYSSNYAADGESSFANTTASYLDNDPSTWEMRPPEYAVIPWSAHGPKNLTVKLSLWFLAMMAAQGDRDIDYSYPALDSWRKEGSKYVHNTTGVTKKRAAKDDKIEGRDPEASELATAGPSAMGAEDDYGEEDVIEASGSGNADIEDSRYRDTGGGDDDDLAEPLYFSQAGTEFGGDDEETPAALGQNYDNGEEDIVDDNGSDMETVVPQPIRVVVTVKRRKLRRGLYFVDHKGREVDTNRSRWTKVDGGYEHRHSRRYTFFTTSFPS